MSRLLDMTYWRFKRWRRRCSGCGKGRDNKLGKVSFSFMFEKPKRYWHYSCQVIERKRRAKDAIR
jgi:hypothetical protein